MTHISDELPRLLSGETSRAEVMAAAEHLRACVDCQQDLVSSVVAHASLTSAHRFAPEILSSLPVLLSNESAEAARSNGNVVALARHAAPNAVSAPLDAPALPIERHDDATPLPDLSAVFAQVRSEVAEPTIRREPTSRRRYLIAAAAAAVLIGTGGSIYAATSTSDNTAPLAAQRTVQLAAFGTGKTTGTAKIASGTITIDASSLPAAQHGRYEVWMTNSLRTRMQPIGWVGNDGIAHLSVPNDLMARYADIEVSVQDMNTPGYRYSGNSVLRGSLT